MRRLFRLLPIAMLLLAAFPAFAQLAVVTGTVTDAGGVGVPNAYLQFDLYGCGGNRPRWTGGVVSSSVQLYGDANGAVTGNVVRNDQITCANTVGNTTYFVQQFINGQPSGPRLQYQINAGTFNWNTQVAITQAPVVAAPTGDTVYARLDGTNMPFTGPVTHGGHDDTGIGTLGAVTGNFSGNETVGGTIGVVGAATVGSIGGNATIKGPNPWIDVTQSTYGAVGDAQIVQDAVTAVGSLVITSATANFQPSDVGKQFSATPTKYSTTGQLTGTITARTSSTSITVVLTSGTATNASNVRFTWGTDNTVAIQAAITAAQAQAKDGDPTGIFFSADVPPLFFPAPSPGRGYIVSGPLLVTKEGVAFTGASRESTNLILNAPTAGINFTAPSGTFHSLEVRHLAVACNYIATNGIFTQSVEENDFSWIQVSDCLGSGVALTGIGGNTSGLSRFYHARFAGNQAAISLNNSPNVEIIGANIFGQTGSSSTLNGVVVSGSGDVAIANSWFEGTLTGIKYDNSAGTAQYGVVLRDSKFLSTVTEARVFSISSANVNNQLTANVIADSNTILTTAATHWVDALINGNVAANTGINIVWEKNIRSTGPIGTAFITDSSTTHIVYEANNGVSGSNINSGAGTVTGADTGAEFQVGPNMTLRGTIITVPGQIVTTGNSITSSNGIICPSSGSCNAGAGGLPFFQVFTDNISLNTAATLLIAGSAPSISSGFGTSPSLPSNNGTASFTVNVGTGGTATNGVIGMPTAATAWNCSVTNITATAGHRADNTVQTAAATNSVTIENQTKSTGAAVAWTASDVVQLSCFGR